MKKFIPIAKDFSLHEKEIRGYCPHVENNVFSVFTKSAGVIHVTCTNESQRDKSLKNLELWLNVPYPHFAIKDDSKKKKGKKRKH